MKAEQNTNNSINSILNSINLINDFAVYGEVTSIRGLIVECKGLESFLTIGTHCLIINNTQEILAEVVGFKEKTAILMPFGDLDGIGIGSKVKLISERPLIYPEQNWLGRVINAFADPIDNKGSLPPGLTGYSLKNSPPPAHKRQRINNKIDLGVKAINSFTTCCYGQRMGIFAGSGIGKSVLMSMITRYAKADIKIIGLVGERGREVQEFIHSYLGEEGLLNTIVVVATSDEPALVRRQAAYLTLTLAEYFRDQGKEVLCIIDNITRFAMAQREIGLASGEPPTSKGYTPSVFSELPKLLERAGPGTNNTSITGFFTVLVEGDDQNEPITDTVRGILDGHIFLDRTIAERGRFPAVNILRSISRTMPECNTEQEYQLIQYAKKLISIYHDMAEIIRIGAYKRGSDPEVDQAILYHPKLEHFFTQHPRESVDLKTSYQQLAEALDYTQLQYD
ncbi:Flagellum-specific ATP synthase [Rickettsiales bacterium Ac37b]|nr:Flagellum-specific ATP synthase [Rickettsiales bacterium Ac37b]